jgi:hypothetical protein
MGIGSRRRSRASIAILTVLLTGCGLLETERLQVAIRNNTDAPALVQMVRFEFPAGTFGAPLGDAMTIPAGERATLKVPIPAAKDWALRINDLPGVTSLGWMEAEDAVTGEGPLTYSITVDVDGLSTSVSRAGGGAGETSAPASD